MNDDTNVQMEEDAARARGLNASMPETTGGGYVSLAELGFLKLARQRRKLLSVAFITGGIGLALALLIFGGYVIMSMQIEERTVFTSTPPPRRTYEPRKLEHTVKLQKRQRSSSRLTIVPRLVAMKKTSTVLPEIKTNPKVIHTSFQPKFKPVSGQGFGVGLGDGNGVSGFGPGVSRFNISGIPVIGEKIAILVDTSTSMVEEDKGGVSGYMRVKQRVNQVVDALADGSTFNVVVFADAADACFEKLVIANMRNRKKAKEYLMPFNTEGNWGLATGNVHANGKGLPAKGGTTRLDLALTAAFQQGADTVLVISDGAPRVLKGISPDEMRAYRNKKAEWESKNQAKVQSWDEKNNGAPAKMVKVWVPPKPARPPRKGPPKEGQAPDHGTPAVPGHWEWRSASAGGHGGGARPQCPVKPPKERYWTLTEFLKHLRLLHEYYYKSKKPPTIHCIGYRIDKEGGCFLKAVAKKYKGKYRRVKTLEVK